VVVRLKIATVDGERKIALLTIQPQTVASAEYLAQLYRVGWSRETLFQTVNKNFDSDFFIPKLNNFILGYKKVSYNILVVFRRALCRVHGVGKIESHQSEFYQS
jgi:hypothetical protein